MFYVKALEGSRKFKVSQYEVQWGWGTAVATALLVIANIQCLHGATGDETAIATNSHKKKTSPQSTADIRPTSAAYELVKPFKIQLGLLQSKIQFM